MKKSRINEEQIVGFLRRLEADKLIKDLCHNGDFSDGASHQWRAKFGGIFVSEAQRLRELDSETAKPQWVLAEEKSRMNPLQNVLQVVRKFDLFDSAGQLTAILLKDA